MFRCASWEAVSSKGQAREDKVSLERQRETNLTAIQSLNAKCVAHLVVPGQSRSIILFEDACRKITAYRQLRELIDTRSIDLLVCYTHSRLGREISLCESVIAYCLAGGVAIYDCCAPPRSIDAKEQMRDAGARLMSVIRSWESQAEVQRLTQNTADGVAKRVRGGALPPGPIAKFWNVEYDTKTGEKIYKINEDEATIAREVIRLYLSGLGMVTIAREYGKDKVWVAYIINQVRKLAGFTEVNRTKTDRPHIVAPGKQPAIIDVDTMQRVLDERASRVGNRRGAMSTHIYSRLVVCEKCNKTMTANKMWGNRGKDGVYKTKELALNCPVCWRWLKFDTIDKALEEWLAKEVDNEAGDYVAVDSEPQPDRRDELTAKLGKVAKEKGRLITLFTSELIELPEYKRRLTGYQQQEDAINKEITELTTEVDNSQHRQEAQLILIDWLRNHMSTMSTAEVNTLYRTCLQINYTVNRKVDISWR